MKVSEIIDGLVEAWRSGDALRAAAFFSEDAVYRDPRHAPIAGRAAIAEHFTRFFRDGPHWRFDVDRVLAAGNHAAVIYRFAVKGEGARWRERAGCAVVETAGGLVREWREYDG